MMEAGINYEQIARDIAKGDLLIIDPISGEAVTSARDTITGLLELVVQAGKKVGSLERRLTEDGRADSHPQGAEIVALIERWKQGTGKAKAKAGANRIKLVKARLKDKFPMRLEPGADPEPSLELAVDGLCAYPYRDYAARLREGSPHQRDDDLDAALKDEKHVEKLSRYGLQARREGWTLEAGWPEAPEERNP